MLAQNYTTLIAIFLLTALAHSQEAKPSKASLSIRAFMHDPSSTAAQMYLKDEKGHMVKLNLTPEDLGMPQLTIPVDGSLILFNTAGVDPKNPESIVAAQVAVPKNMQRAIVIVIPGPENSTPAYRMVLMDDSAAAFPPGASKVLTLVSFDTALEAGEHKVLCAPGKVTNVAAVKKLDPYNMAQTNFYFKKNDSWIVFSECKMKYLDAYRQIFIAYMRPGSNAPELTTLIDQMPKAATAK